jgi:AcrR family transcriptional regulator
MTAALEALTSIDPRAVRSSQAISAAFLKLLETRPVEQITIREIVEEAEVHRATFFRHHASKDELLNHIAADQIRHLVDLTLPILDSAGQFTSNRAFCAYVETHRALWKALLTGGAAASMRAEWLRLAYEITSKHSHTSRLPISLSVRCTVSVIAEAIIWWLSEANETVDVDAISMIIHELVSPFSEKPAGVLKEPVSPKRPA